MLKLCVAEESPVYNQARLDPLNCYEVSTRENKRCGACLWLGDPGEYPKYEVFDQIEMEEGCNPPSLKPKS
jgi:hypothetical protein